MLLAPSVDKLCHAQGHTIYLLVQRIPCDNHNFKTLILQSNDNQQLSEKN